MAQRRMFSLKIVDTDAFLDMPQSSQLLYFHLSMRADDDGFVSNPKKIMRAVGSQDDDLKVLFTKRFVLPFNSGVCVIKHWHIHNYIQNDRYTPTQYVKEKALLEIDEDTQKYRLKSGDVSKKVDNVSKMDTQDRGRVVLGKDKENALFNKFWDSYPKKVSKKKTEQIWNKIPPSEHDSIFKALQVVRVSSGWTKDGGQFIPYPATWLNQERWKDEVSTSAPPKRTCKVCAKDSSGGWIQVKGGFVCGAECMAKI